MRPTFAKGVQVPSSCEVAPVFEHSPIREECHLGESVRRGLSPNPQPHCAKSVAKPTGEGDDR